MNVLVRVPSNSIKDIDKFDEKKTPSIYLASQELYNEAASKSRIPLLKYHIRS